MRASRAALVLAALHIAVFAAAPARAGDLAADCSFIEEAFTGLNTTMNAVSAQASPEQVPALQLYAGLQRNLILLHGQRGCEAGLLVDIIRDSGGTAPPDEINEGAVRPAAPSGPITVAEVPMDAMEKGMVVKTNANMRAAPTTDAPRIAIVQANGIVPVIGKVKGANWYRVRLDGGVEGFVFGDLLGDPTEAVAATFESMEARATRGEADAQLWLGNYYVGKDMFEAVSWWQAAAEQGNPQAQYNLGVAYKRGGVLPKDDDKAEEWWRKAAEGGHSGAQRALAGEADG